MKTKIANPAQSRSKNVLTQLLSSAFLVAALLISTPSHSKNVVPGIRVSNYVTGNQLGSNLSASLVLGYGKCNLAVGPNIQMRNFHVSGVQSSFRYDFGNEDGKASIYLFTSFIYQKSAFLGKGCVKTQYAVEHESQVHFETIKVSTVEMYGGFGLNIKHNDYLSSSCGVGFGMYNTISGHMDSMNLYREKSAAVLFLKYAITFNFVKQK